MIVQPKANKPSLFTYSHYLQRMSKDSVILFAVLSVFFIVMSLFILLPLWAMLKKSVLNNNGEFVGFDNHVAIFANATSAIGPEYFFAF